MIATLKKFKYLIIIVIVLIVAFIGYTIYTSSSATPDSASLQRTTTDGSGNSVAVVGTGNVVPNNDLAKSFVDQLLLIKNIDLKVAFFSDPVFIGLKDNHKDIDRQLIGRPNPFAPIGTDAGPASGNYQDINGYVVKSAGETSGESTAGSTGGNNASSTNNGSTLLPPPTTATSSATSSKSTGGSSGSTRRSTSTTTRTP